MHKYFVVGGLLLSLPLPAAAQQPAEPATARLADCVRDIKGDSVALYFNGRYELTPVACATICRYTHLDPQGRVYGEVRDYRLPAQQLLYRQHYDHGVRQGSYEAFYPNGQLRVRGFYTQDEPSGEWQFWYFSGKPRQTLQRDLQVPLTWRFLAYHDSTGQQRLVNGTGYWVQVNPRQQLRAEGAVENGLPAGEWKLTHLAMRSSKQPEPYEQLLTVETYEQGHFRKGHNVTGSLPNYRDQPRIGPTLNEPSQAAQHYTIGLNCDATAQVRQNSPETAQQTAKAKKLTQPRPDGDAGNYLRLLLHKLADYPSMQALLRNPYFNTTVEAEVDEQGTLRNFRSATPDVQRVFAQVVPPLGRWYAAIADQQPAIGHVTFVLNVLDEQWQVHYRVTRIDIGNTTVKLSP